MSRPIAIGGDIFAGMFTQGIVESGFDVPIHLEHGPYGVKSAQMNFPGLEVRQPHSAWRPETIKRVDFMFTNPPCAPWSTASHGRKATWQEDPRVSCVTTLRDAGMIIRPKAWAWESVAATWKKGREFVDEQARLWMAEGYHVTVLLQNNMLLGAAQNRKRLFFIAHQHPLVWPALTLKPPTIGQVLKTVKIKEAEKKYITGAHKELWEMTDSGVMRKAYGALTATEQQRISNGWCIPSFLCRRYQLDRVAPVYFHEKAYHPTEARLMTYREALAFCGLPSDWQLEQLTVNAINGFLSRGVMAPVGKWLGTAVKDGLTEKKLNSKKPVYRVVNMLTADITEEVLN